VSVETFQNGISNPEEIKPGLIPWVHPLQSGDTSLHLSLVMKLTGGQAMGVMDAGFDSVTDESLLGSYPAKDCIQENLVFLGFHASRLKMRKLLRRNLFKTNELICSAIAFCRDTSRSVAKIEKRRNFAFTMIKCICI
jgi:hypothetical protein